MSENGGGNPLWVRDYIRVQNLLDEIEPLGALGIKREALVEDIMAIFPKGTAGRRLLERKVMAAKKTGHGSAKGMGLCGRVQYAGVAALLYIGRSNAFSLTFVRNCTHF